MGHLEEHREAISANEQVAGREERVWDELLNPGTSGRTRGHGTPMALGAATWKPLSWDGARGKLNFPCRWEGGAFSGWWPLRVPWSHTVQGQLPPGVGGKGVSRTGSAGRAVGAAPVFELHHLLLPRTQAPSLGADGEYAIVLHAHLVQLGAVKLHLLCPQLQVDLLVTWEEEGPGQGVQSRRGGASQSEQRQEL